MKPKGRSLKAYESGKKAYKEGRLLSSNPRQYGPNQVMASWWDKGWTEEYLKTKGL